MSFQFVKRSKNKRSCNVWCRMSECKWTGDSTKLVEHVEQHHPHHIRSIHPDSYFELTFEDLQTKDPFLLCANNGIYWFAQKNKDEEGCFSRGLFKIAYSKPVKYSIKLGTISTKIMEMHGPFLSRNERSHQYDFNMENEYMEYLAIVMTPKVVIYFGEFDEESDEHGTCGMGAWPMNTTPENYGYPETYICSACRELIAGAPLFCPNRHFLCEDCDRLVRDGIGNNNGISDCPRCDQNEFRDTQSEDIAFVLIHSTYQYLIEANDAL